MNRKSDYLISVVLILVMALAVCPGCGKGSSRLIMETRRSAKEALRRTYWPDYVARDEKDMKGPMGEWDKLSRYFGVFKTHYDNISEGVKPVRISLLEAGSEYMFEVETVGSIEAARSEYDWRMQFEIRFEWDEYCKQRIVYGGCSSEALLLTGGVSEIIVQLDSEGHAVEARDETRYKVQARFKAEMKGNILRIHVPKKEMPGRERLNKPKSDFGWSVFVRLAIEPLDPIPSNIPEVYALPMICSMCCPDTGTQTVLCDSWYFRKPPEEETKGRHPRNE